MSGGGDQPRKLFTLEEANLRLPLVKAIVKDIVTLFSDLHDRRERLNELRHRSEQSEYRDEVDAMESELETDIERLDVFVAELSDLGAELKDPLTGLVDFRTLVDGREAYLCWKLEEDEIGWWHDLDAGVNGRRPVSELQEPVSASSSGTLDSTHEDPAPDDAS